MNNKMAETPKIEVSTDQIVDYAVAYSALEDMRLSVCSLTAEELIDQTMGLIDLLEEWIKLVQHIEKKLDYMLANQ